MTKFMGVPIDGSRSEMISKLKQKGFTYNTRNDYLEGEFNGRDVFIYIVTNKEKVYRVFVADKKFVDEAQIKIWFNNLVSQFEHNKNYYSSDSSQYIKENERISYQMSVNKKYYDARFYQKNDNDLCFPIELLDNIDSIQYEGMHEQIHSFAVELCKTIANDYYEKHYLAETKDLNELEVFEFDKNLLKVAAYVVGPMQWLNRKVWFRIYENYGNYSIGIYYDNLYNAPNGEDL